MEKDIENINNEIENKPKRRIKKEARNIIIATILLIIGFLNDYQTRYVSYIALVCYAISYALVGLPVIVMAIKNIRRGNVLDEHFLMSIATIGAIILGEYTEAVFVMLFYQVGEFFQNFAVDNSRKSIKALIEYAPEVSNVIRDGEEIVVETDEVEVGEIIRVKVGEKIPLDGIIRKGETSLNMAFLTGESMPVDVKVGDEVYSGSINNSGVIEIEVTKDSWDSTVSQILELIEESTEKKATLESFISRFARVYTPIVVVLALILAFIPPLITGTSFYIWIQRALIFLVVSCPCALVVSVPMSFFSGIGRASKNGILVKGGNYLEVLSKTKTVVFDKTGTLTYGVFKINNEISFSDNEWREIGSSLESYSTHPIAKSITSIYGNKYKDEITNIEEIRGKGLKGEYNGKIVAAGNLKLMRDLGSDIEEIDEIGSHVYIMVDGKVSGVFIISDTIKDDTKEGLARLKKLGVDDIVLLTGDKKDTAEKIASDLGIDRVYSELLPEDKVSYFEDILENSKDRKVAFVGDGINDAPVLRRSDVGIAMGALGSDAAIEASDIVLMNDEITKISEAYEISKLTVRVARQNVIFALGVKIVVLILATFGLAPMWLAIFADVGVTILAVINSLRIL